MKISVAVVFGGRSVEHEVSVITAMQIIAAIDKKKYDAVPLYITKDGSFYTGEDFTEITSYSDIPKLLENGKRVGLVRSGGKIMLSPTEKKIFGGDKPILIDVALPAVHGTFVEDGSLQGFFELLGLPYCGSDVLSSAVCMDKPTAKCLLRAKGLPVLPDVTVTRDRYDASPEEFIKTLESKFAYPMIIKPANLGSSVGITKAASRSELESAVELAFSFADNLLIEPAVVNLREINVSVLGDKHGCRASCCEEPVSADEILSYTDKYLSQGKSRKNGGMSEAKRTIPANITKEMEDNIKQLAQEAFMALGCGGVVRIDFLVDNNEKVYINELNTIPGSMAFYLWECAELPFAGLIDELINGAFTRRRERGNLTFTYDTNILSQQEMKGAKS